MLGPGVVLATLRAEASGAFYIAWCDSLVGEILGMGLIGGVIAPGALARLGYGLRGVERVGRLLRIPCRSRGADLF